MKTSMHSRRAMTALAVMAIIGTLMNGTSRAASCQGRLGIETNIVGKSNYDPFSPADLVDTYRISIRNTGSEPCLFALIFRSRANDLKLGNQLNYRLASADKSPLPTNAPAMTAATARSNRPILPAETAQFEYQLIIPRGQFAAPGQLRDTIGLELYAVDDGGRLAATPLETKPLSFSYDVERIMSVNIKGADTTTTLSFGKLAEGQQRLVDIQVRSNASYQLDVASDNNGVLALTPKVSGQIWSVPYTAALDGQSIRWTKGASLQNLPPTRPEQDASHSLKVTIGDASRKRAGRYEDVITIEIKGAGF